VKNLILFGTGQIGELAHYYFTQHTDYRIVAFTVDGAFIDSDKFIGLPVLPFENLEQTHSPQYFDLFVALSYSKMNIVRAKKYTQARDKGYNLASYISPKATIFDNVEFGDNCFILENNVIQPFVKIGSNCTLWSGNHIGHHSVIEDDCFIASHVVISGGVLVKKKCFIGVNATIRDHITLGEASLIGAGALILESTEPGSVYVGTRTEPRKMKSSNVKRI
jgi:sugar O-acyltransferase (sialic acid O-acetyltransferase NeuD family)